MGKLEKAQWPAMAPSIKGMTHREGIVAHVFGWSK